LAALMSVRAGGRTTTPEIAGQRSTADQPYRERNQSKSAVKVPLLSFPDDMFNLRPGEAPMYGELPELKRAVDYFKSLMTVDQWTKRREAVATRFYNSLIGELNDPTGRYFDEDDSFGWYLFLGEAFNDHPHNYEVVYGCRVIPILAAIGQNLDTLRGIKGFSERALRLLGSERRQPNGILFEMLVAAAYVREGGKVVFRPEAPGKEKSHDLDVEKGGKRWAIEYKRMESGEYAETERQRMRDLWYYPSLTLLKENRSVILDVRFKIELMDVSENYLLRKIERFLRRTGLSFHMWADAVSIGSVGDLDLLPIQAALKHNHLLYPGPQYNKILTGNYQRYDSMLLMQRVKYTENPHFIEEVDLAIVARWNSLSEQAIDKKARDILKRLSEANGQLPDDVSGVIHIGFEALGVDLIEERRFQKILETARNFDRGKSKLEYIYCHCFAPEASPEETWAIDETVQWLGIRPGGLPLKPGILLPAKNGGRAGVHWIN